LHDGAKFPGKALRFIARVGQDGFRTEREVAEHVETAADGPGDVHADHAGDGIEHLGEHLGGGGCGDVSAGGGAEDDAIETRFGRDLGVTWTDDAVDPDGSVDGRTQLGEFLALAGVPGGASERDGVGHGGEIEDDAGRCERAEAPCGRHHVGHATDGNAEQEVGEDAFLVACVPRNEVGIESDEGPRRRLGLPSVQAWYQRSGEGVRQEAHARIGLLDAVKQSRQEGVLVEGAGVSVHHRAWYRAVSSSRAEGLLLACVGAVGFQVMHPLLTGLGLLMVAIVLEVFATSMLQASRQFTRLVPSLLTALGYVGAFYFLALSLRTIPLGVAYAVWAGIGIVLVALIAVLVFRQPVDAAGVLGIALIISGVVVLNVFSGMARH